MRVSRAQADENRERIIDTAAQLFREKGFDGIGLNDLMQAAGLTRGGFYGHFESKQDLAVQACRRALQANAVTLGDGLREGLATFVDGYLSDAHCADAGGGCALAALAADVARQDESLRAVLRDGVARFATALESQVAGATEAERRDAALASLAMLVGAVILARAVGDASLSADLRAAARRGVLAHAG
ncbi:MAG TPA: TetR family transcriptional regulator [Tahibacter sp.]|uniref:TetR/AcrR family transcriptional regulator n=1 Tax=Tahibacter sp. TaxID=2056211 RepID=UPI002C9F40C1|nr:TetR family transcriptional regulator [Tahibacter sp.]HSX62540.1 TetR family transcriptional regulator [Tahibacter sp.]